MKVILFLFFFIFSIQALHVRIPAANKTILDKLYSYGITVGSKGELLWDVYLENYKLDLLSSITTYENVLSKKSLLDYTGYKYQNASSILKRCFNLKISHKTQMSCIPIGASVEGKFITNFIITQKNRTISQTKGKKEILLLSGQYGDESIGRELLMKLIDYLMENSESDPVVKDILDKYVINIVPNINPDGFLTNSRTNSNGIDLNRNFKDKFYNQINRLQVETRIINTILRNMDLVANFMSGNGIFTSYPPYNKLELYPDDNLFKTLAKTYSSSHNVMNSSVTYTDGIINGAMNNFYYGGMSDWIYEETKAKMITVELSHNKHVSGSNIETLWNENKLSIFNFIKSLSLL